MGLTSRRCSAAVRSCVWFGLAATTAASDAGASAVSRGRIESFAVYALSRGAGVPDATFEALDRARTVFEDMAVRDGAITLKEQRIGLEGETRLCVEFADPALGFATLRQVRELTAGVELIDIAIEPCAPLDFR